MTMLEEKFSASERVRKLSEQVVRKEKAVKQALDEIIGLYESATVNLDGFVKKLVEQRKLHKDRLKKIEDATKQVLDMSDIEEVELRLMNALLKKLQEKK